MTMKTIEEITELSKKETLSFINEFCKNVDPTKYKMCIKDDWGKNTKEIWFELLEDT